MVLEGGYNVSTVTECVTKCVAVLVGEGFEGGKSTKGPSNGVLKVLEIVRSAQAPFWKCLRPPEVYQGELVS